MSDDDSIGLWNTHPMRSYILNACGSSHLDYTDAVTQALNISSCQSRNKKINQTFLLNWHVRLERKVGHSIAIV